MWLFMLKHFSRFYQIKTANWLQLHNWNEIDFIDQNLSYHLLFNIFVSMQFPVARKNAQEHWSAVIHVHWSVLSTVNHVKKSVQTVVYIQHALFLVVIHVHR